MQCEKCNHYQDSGKFCGKCGGKLVETTEQVQEITQTEQVTQQEQVEQAATVDAQVNIGRQDQMNTEQTTQQAQSNQGFTQQTQANQYQQTQEPNQHIEQVKETSKAFGHYYVRFIKKPSEIFNDSTQFVNGAISLILFSVLFGIVVGAGVPSELREALDIPFIKIFFTIFVFSVIILATVILATFIIFKLFGQEKSFKELVNYYGVLSLPALSILPITFILLIVESYRFGFLTLFISFLLITSILPAYLVSSFQSKFGKSIDGIYSYLLYVGIYSFLTFIIYSVVLDSFMSKLQSSIGSWFYF